MNVRRTLLALAFGAGLAACGGTDDRAIHIAIAGPLGQANGRSMRMAAEMAAEEINRAGGVHGRLIEIVAQDDNGTPEQAINVAAELRDDPRIVAVVGHVNSAATLAAAEVYNDAENGLLQISPSWTGRAPRCFTAMTITAAGSQPRSPRRSRPRAEPWSHWIHT